MPKPKIVSPDEWATARKRLLLKEKELTRQRDALSAERRSLPMVALEKEYMFAGSLVHLAARDTAFAVISRAPLAKIAPFKKRMGWTFPWLSSYGTDFNDDFGVTLDATHTTYNYAPVSQQPEGRPHEGEREGLSVFFRDGTRVFHTYSTYQRGLDPLLNTYNLLDLTPLGRQEEDGIMHWLKYHDEY